MQVSWAKRVCLPVNARIGGGPNHVRPRTHQCAQDLQLGGGLGENLGELLCQDVVPIDEHKDQNWEQPRLGPVTVSSCTDGNLVHGQLG